MTIKEIVEKLKLENIALKSLKNCGATFMKLSIF